MKRTINKLFVTVLAVIAALCFAFVVGSAIPAKAADEETTSVFGISGAQVRIATDENTDDSGIRFVANINKAAYDAIVEEAGNDTVFFGIELSVNDIPMSFCYTANNLTGLTGFDLISFADDSSVYTYTASITYNEAILLKQLVASPDHNPNGYDADAFKANGLLDKYLDAAYKTEITAKAYYQVGNTDDAEKVYAVDTVTRSVFGVATEAYVNGAGDDTLFDENGNFALVGKYFESATTSNETVTINEYGKITGYSFESTDLVYVDCKPVTVTNNAIDKSIVSGLTDGDTLNICVVTESGAMVNLSAKFDMLAQVITTEAIYDATAQIIYYETADGVQKVDATNAFLVEDGTEFELVKNQYLFNKKDAVVFSTVSHHVDDVSTLNADLTVKTTDGTALKEVTIAYDVATADYTGVAMNIKNADGDILYSLSDVVLATAVIDDGAELKEIFNKADKEDESVTVNSSPDGKTYGNITKGVFMLADDIDAKEEGKEFVFTNSYLNFFDGLLDGRGHNVKNLDVSGSADKPGNGLFSAISFNSAIQNIAFIDVVAKYGSVFQGNSAELNPYYGTYAMMYNGAWSYNIGVPQYRRQLGIPDTDTTTPITNYLTTTWRVFDANSLPNSPVYSNLYVKVSSETTNFMGVFSRDLRNANTQLRAYNTVIEYLPTDTSWVPEDYSQSGYGVLFGGAYEGSLEVASTAETKAKTWYTPSGVETSWSGAGVLNYVRDDLRYNGYATKIVVISNIGLVSCVKGSILDTNDTVTEANPYKFYSQKAYGWTAGGADKGTLLRYDDINAYNADIFRADNGHSYLYNTTSTDKFWNYVDGHLAWKNLPAETPVA